MKKHLILNIISIVTILVLGLISLLIINDDPITWKLFPGDSVLFFPLIFIIPIILSILSLKEKKNILAKIILILTVLIIVIAILLSIFLFALGSGYQI